MTKRPAMKTAAKRTKKPAISIACKRIAVPGRRPLQS